MQVLNIFHVLVAIAMVAFVLLQRGPGATAGAAFGSGASGTVFGSRGAGSFLSRTTWILAMLFCVISLTMAVIVSRTVATPDTEVGVVGSPQVEEPAAGDDSAVLPELDDVGQDSDLPEMDTANQAQSQGDLPLLEEETEGVPDPQSGTTGEEAGDNPGGG
jgi:preprotein translocase subunit SecG